MLLSEILRRPRPPSGRAGVRLTGPAYVEAGDRVTLTCNATGSRTPESVDWFKDGAKLQPSHIPGMQVTDFMDLSVRGRVTWLWSSVS